jgi:hypothetical protein
MPHEALGKLAQALKAKKKKRKKKQGEDQPLDGFVVQVQVKR